MPSFVLLLLLGFDYDAFHKHVFHVYPLPAYGVAALWAGLGLQWVAGRWAWSRAARATAAAALLAATAAVGAWGNVLAGYGWVERYGRALLEALPRDAVVLLKGADIGPLAYLHLVEGVRPDVTLYHPQGLVLGNRLFHPIRTDPAAQEAALRAFVAQAAGPVATTAPALAGLAWREHWLFMTLDREAPRPAIAVAVPPDLARFYEEGVRAPRERNPYIAFYQGELRRRYVALAALGGETRGLEAMAQDFYGALGAVEGLLAGGQGYSLRLAARLLDAAAQGMPRDASKQQRARFLELRAYVRLELGDRRGALEDLEWAAAAWPVPANGAAAALKRLRRP
jgi:hypothetical protein